MPTYVDAAIVHIQRYLTRGSKLRGHSFGSSRISDVSRRYSHAGDDRALAELQLGELASGWGFNPELGKIDGVVSLIHRGGADDATARDVAGLLLDALRRSWPGAELQAAWGHGATYADARSFGIDVRLAGHTGRQAEPAVAEFPLARPCSQCESDAAVSAADDGASALCVDCSGRSRRPANSDTRSLAFDGLAARGGTNHLAAVYVDGNAVGQLFTALAGRDASFRRGLSTALPRATLTALDSACRVAADMAGEGPVPVIRHVVGGDDVLVSVPAPYAWPFTRHLLLAFEQAVAAEVGDLLGCATADPASVGDALFDATGGAARAPTAAAGLVFAHVKHPFAATVRTAGERLRAAKRAGSGTNAVIAWTDITIDGDDPPAWRQPWQLTDLEDRSDALSSFAKTGKTARHELAQLIDLSRPMTTWCRLRTHLDRLTDENLVAAATPFVDDVIASNADLTTALARLLDAIAVARWWS